MASTPTISVNSPPSSSRPSLDSSAAPSRLSSDSLHSLASLPSHTGTPPNPSFRQPPSQRRNRSALREFYGLRRRDDESPAAAAAAAAATASAPSPSPSPRPESNWDSSDESAYYLPASEQLDALDFDAAACVERILSARDLRGLLRVENGLVNDVRGLDGERKSLVYDNYNKLIAATDTIRSMRSNMDPLTPATTTLLPAIAHIASVSSSLVASVHAHDDDASPSQSQSQSQSQTDRRSKQQAAVRYALSAPERVRTLLAQGDRTAAEREWAAARACALRWRNVRAGQVDRFLEAGEKALKGG